MTGIIEMRKENQEDFQNRYGVKLGFMSFFVKACVAALKIFPSVNAEIDNDEIKIRPIMYLALSYDHRIIDGKESVSFLKMVKENLEDPRRLFLNI